ncbi:carboxylate--amine ligase/circularly permuted type 2 ATP-grasp protein [Frankia sp. CNm7]|uniref:Putative glutamate--cysteine ligase 2 n=1 Tax=Frankia nepalensis TaxID=1836974 RepID=A0A937UQ81_9ACTN|nr:carboxylate--amine ligase/circularly permuted type 2 ATP-grasp protein [Frankia nepalensis]MBL7496458.1 carboxylate--amine ligase/circularly permuted type 2 ATP-grasp protein [Frankia nepalensis]MBL7510805.1 carboxylate--amine ligase/circularly permuted type 2 ATP-grasp protein [Frankia nepalensis]MBL7521698.1 carboxylate--amine ligase/circularly permuted type 2 ATP-grasp protein [Frankia nepalensis]MBL7631604.1 carboxylate--amine ligase/circularly permuted type 2 ATP-grasp protein [Frankia 
MSGPLIPAVGVEEEFHILDLATRQLVPRAEEILEVLPAGDRFTGELLKSVVETNSAPTRDLAALRADLVDSRRQLAAAAESLGLGPVAAGTVPIVDPATLEISRDPRYLQMTEEYQILAREQVICGAHVHVDVADRDAAMAVIGYISPWLPLMLALSASSPYWMGADSGYASMRTMVWQRWPTAGVAAAFPTASEYDQLVTDLVKSGVISDPGMVYFDIRPSAHLPTVELRVCDACPDVDTVVLIAGLFRGLVGHAVDQIDAGRQAPVPRPELLRAATWRAARSGLEGDLVELTGGGAGPVPADELLDRLLTEIRPWLEKAGDWELLSGLAEQAVRRGSAAAAERRAFRRRGLLTDVADLLLARTRVADPGSDAAPSAGATVEAPADSAGLARADRIAPTLLAGYQASADFRPDGFDEVLDGRGAVRAPYRAMLRTLERLGPDVLAEQAAARRAEQVAAGMVFRVTGETESRPMPFDLVPRIVAAADWATIGEGLSQRTRALEAFLRDVYSDRYAIADKIVPEWAVAESPGLRHWGRVVPAGAIRATVCGIDLVRDRDGRWLVLEDNLRVPSGAGYAVAARRLTRSALPELAPPPGILGLDGVPALLRSALVAAAPPAAHDRRGGPALALLTSGPIDSAYFEHELLASQMGVPLLEPGQLVVDGDAVAYLDPAGGGPRRIDVLYRRIDDDDLFAATGADGGPLGPALFGALAAGTVSLANAPGNGVADDKVIYAYVNRMITYYLGEQPLLEDVPTYICGDPEQLDHVLRHLDQLVLKPIDGYGGADVLIGPYAEPHELTGARERLLAEPRRWIGQEMVALSTHPTWAGDPEDPDGGPATPVSANGGMNGAGPAGGAGPSRLEPRAVDLRAFVYQGERTVVAPAALSRVAPAGSLVVNSSRGGGCKDTWLLRG